MKDKTEIWFVEDTQNDLDSYWFNEKGDKITKRDLLIGKWNEITDKAHITTRRKRVLL